ncbi:hypothetical protein ACHAQJ_007047 [Trichoderma viride]
MSEASGVEEVESRRKLQNRLNQRASRRRKKELQRQQQPEGSQFNKWVFYVDPRTGKRRQDGPQEQQQNQKQHQQGLTQARSTPNNAKEVSDLDRAVVVRNHNNERKYYDPGFPEIFLSKKYRDKAFRFFCNMTREDRGDFYYRLYDLVSRNVAKYTLDSQLLLSVMQFNVIRAAATNALAIGVGMEEMAEDIISPFNYSAVLPALPPAPSYDGTTPIVVNGVACHGNGLEHLPPNLQPTALQRQIIHHPWIDLCPQPSLRNALLRRLHSDFDEDEFCHHMFLQSGQSDEDGMIGMVVWGEACDPTSYEISATMIRKWPWIVAECPDIITTTNYWRRKRHEEPVEIS